MGKSQIHPCTLSVVFRVHPSLHSQDKCALVLINLICQAAYNPLSTQYGRAVPLTYSIQLASLCGKQGVLEFHGQKTAHPDPESWEKPALVFLQPQPTEGICCCSDRVGTLPKGGRP